MVRDKLSRGGVVGLVVLVVMVGGVGVGMALDGQAPTVEWNKTYGGAFEEAVWSVTQTADGGFALGGHVEDSDGSLGFDALVIKVNAQGTEGWSKTYEDSTIYSISQTSDGGYILAGWNRSNEGSQDAWVAKVNAQGTEEWSKAFGGSGNELGSAIIQTPDGDYLLVGTTTSFGAGESDAWAVKVSSQGVEEWNKTYGGSGSEVGTSVTQTADGSYALAGATNTFGEGSWDAWIVKVDSQGIEEWNRTYGGAGSEALVEDAVQLSITRTKDGGYLLAGETDSFGSGSLDAWIVKVDSQGAEEWNNTIGGGKLDIANSVIQTTDGGYLFAGATASFGAGGVDAWVVKLNAQGTEEWNATYGGTNNDLATSITNATDGGYAVGGIIRASGDTEGDAWLLKIGTDSQSVTDRYDANNNELIETEELRTAIREWAAGDLETSGLRQLIEVWARS